MEKEMAIHSRTPAWKIPWTEEPDRLHSPRGCKESDTTERLSDFTFMTEYEEQVIQPVMDTMTLETVSLFWIKENFFT